jgi:hypothetical protein
MIPCKPVALKVFIVFDSCSDLQMLMDEVENATLKNQSSFAKNR